MKSLFKYGCLGLIGFFVLVIILVGTTDSPSNNSSNQSTDNQSSLNTKNEEKITPTKKSFSLNEDVVTKDVRWKAKSATFRNSLDGILEPITTTGKFCIYYPIQLQTKISRW